ncbi:hypothetical protein [Mucilaginibacter sp. 3215]|uniref:hypothetical protein n=1 Tax=Mucilaginibacter sp. 3215 TaxID=3373912 RepID=UPI003D2294B3
MNNYLNMIRVYLNQELPPPFNTLVSVVDDRIKITLPDTHKSFNEAFAVVHPMIIECIGRIRELKYNVDFTIWTPGQLRDFTIRKAT